MKKKVSKVVWRPPFKKFIFWWIPDGWEDLGKIGTLTQGEFTNTKKCRACFSRVRLGRISKNNLFWYCKKCQIQIVREDGSYLYV